MRGGRWLVAVVVVLSVAVPVAAHVPSFPADNTSPERAVVVPDPVKSWSFYDSLAPGQARYYRMVVFPGERLRVGAFTPVDGPFAPSLVVMSPGIDDREPVPSWVTVPAGMGAVVVEGSRPSTASYEPFAPSATYHTARVDRAVSRTTTVVVAVYEPSNRSGPTGVTIGSAESFSVREYLTVPFDLVRVHLWAGQQPLLVVGPLLVGLVVGGAVVRSRRRTGAPSPRAIVLAAGGSVILGSALATLLQTGFALARTGPTAGVLVTAVFVVVPGVVGTWVLVGVRAGGASLAGRRARVALAVAAVASLVTWAGFLLGPALLVVGALAPRTWRAA